MPGWGSTCRGGRGGGELSHLLRTYFDRRQIGGGGGAGMDGARLFRDGFGVYGGAEVGEQEPACARIAGDPGRLDTGGMSALVREVGTGVLVGRFVHEHIRERAEDDGTLAGNAI